MNQDRSANDGQVQAETKPSAHSRRMVLVLGAILVLAAGGFLIFLQADADVGCVGEGPCMLYFYAEW
jgi:hypothetical protein